MRRAKEWANSSLMALVFGLAGIFLFSSGMAVAGQGGDLNNYVIRLHILAEDNSQAEQQLKLDLRDGIWEFVRDLTAHASSMPAAKAIISENLTAIEERAKEISAGREIRVRLSEGLGFPSMMYGSLFLPQGQYTALQIIIGEGAGENWWCIMFPPMCLMDVTRGQVVQLSEEEAEQIILRPRLRIGSIFR
ncbi:MAG: stage II sporulation protein R [Defluviitaleaceae bacterium]|nr:stage II sporulation protein R [Defluviitaleaceae bacterium]